jgi:hypothetical protein
LIYSAKNINSNEPIYMGKIAAGIYTVVLEINGKRQEDKLVIGY